MVSVNAMLVMTPCYAVEWLRSLAQASGQAESPGLNRGWPFGKKAAACITHDVDTGWLFRNPDWLERLSSVEGNHGFHGGWYCVPKYSEDRLAAKGMERLLELRCEVGVHGYNHDAQLQLKSGAELEARLKVVRDFAARWDAKGFRSEWLFYNPGFLRELAKTFYYDTSAPASLPGHHPQMRTGCSSCRPFRTHGGMVELPLSLPMDEGRHEHGESIENFWTKQVERAWDVIDQGGLIVLSLHPQSHQSANPQTLPHLDRALAKIAACTDLWIARPRDIASWADTGALPG